MKDTKLKEDDMMMDSPIMEVPYDDYDEDDYDVDDMNMGIDPEIDTDIIMDTYNDYQEQLNSSKESIEATGSLLGISSKVVEAVLESFKKEKKNIKEEDEKDKEEEKEKEDKEETDKEKEEEKKESVNSKNKTKKRKFIITLPEDVRIPDTDIILEKGERISVITEQETSDQTVLISNDFMSASFTVSTFTGEDMEYSSIEGNFTLHPVNVNIKGAKEVIESGLKDFIDKLGIKPPEEVSGEME
jgi:hypothetical protein